MRVCVRVCQHTHVSYEGKNKFPPSQKYVSNQLGKQKREKCGKKAA